MNRRTRAVWLGLAAVAVIVAIGLAFVRPQQQPEQASASASPGSTSPVLIVPRGLSQRCHRPTAHTSTQDAHPVGDPTSPQVGPISFHPSPFEMNPETGKPYPTKVLIEPMAVARDVITIQGARCGDAAPLRLAYHDVAPEFPVIRATFTLDTAGPNLAYTGYMVFAGPGAWTVDVFSGRNYIGNLLIDVVTSG